MMPRMVKGPHLWLVSAWLSLAPALAAGGAEDRSTMLKSPPPAVQRTVEVESKGAEIRGVAKGRGEDGKPVYEIMTSVNGLARDIIVGADGTLPVTEQQVTMASLPAVVRATIIKAADGRKIAMIDTVSRGGKLACYEARVGSGKVVSEIKVAPDGKLVR